MTGIGHIIHKGTAAMSLDKPVIQRETYSVVLPCDPADFGAFVSGLLGKPQTIERRVPGPFLLTRQDVVNLCHLVDQRIHQQNEATLIQFTIRIGYRDNSSVLLKSLADFESFTEIRPLVSASAYLSWTYLVRFRNKAVPEKQQIDLSFIGDDANVRSGGSITYDEVGIERVFLHPSAYYYFRMLLTIQHTERTWGVDLDSLLQGALGHLVIKRKKIAELIERYSSRIGATVAVSLLAVAAGTVIVTSQAFLNSYLARAEELSKAVAASDMLSSKIDFLIDVITRGTWPRFVFAAVTFLIISVAASIAMGVWVSDKASIRARSFVLLSRAAEDEKRQLDQRIKRDWMLFGLSVAASVIGGVASSWLFARFFSS